VAVRIELFGNLQITHEQQPVTQINTNRLRSLLAFLVLHSDTAQSREQLAFLLWPESSESQARTNLRQLLHHLRRALPAECDQLRADNHSVQWRRDSSCSVDVVEFDAAIAHAASARKRNNPQGEEQALEEAVRLYQDDLVRGLYDAWLEPKREQYRQQLEQVLGRLAELHEEAHDFAAAIRYAERLVTLDPIREIHHQRLIRLHAANHDRASALRAYHQCMRVLRRELGVEPGRETRELFDTALKSSLPERPARERPATGSPVPDGGPMVGREREWERLMACWRLAMRGETQAALILGEPGIGKSRLAEELYEWCAGRQEAVARARCYAAQGQLAFAPIAQWLRTKPLKAACSELPQSHLAELARILPEILAENTAIQRPGPLTESWERHHFYESLNAAFVKARKPLLLMVDDLQWCDQDSFEWLQSLFRCEGARGILMLATVRPEETGRDHPFTRFSNELLQSGLAIELPLQPLSAAETAELAGRVSTQVSGRTLGEADVEELYRSTKGNPLFVVESVRAGLPGTAASSRIYAVIAARLAQLSPRAYELAGLASAIGHEFTFDLLAKATDWDEDSVSRALEELWQRRIVGSQGGSQGSSQGSGNAVSGQYDFTHDRLREVTYAELSPVRRRFLHRRVARALEESGAELQNVSGVLAAHYEAAGMPELAMGHYRQAAAVAHQRYADAEEAGLLRRALAICRDLPESAVRDERELELLTALGLALVTTQGYAMPEVGAVYARALELSRRLGEDQHLFSVLSGSWSFHMVSAKLDTSRELAQQFLDLAGSEAPAVPAAAGYFVIGSNQFHLGRFETSEQHLHRALQAYGPPPHSVVTLFAGPDIGVFCQAYLSHVLWHLGDQEHAETKSREAIARARKLSHPFSLALALNYAAMLHLFRQESQQALAPAEESATLCRRYEFAYYLPMAEILAGSARSASGEAETGLTQLRNGIDGLKATGAELRLPFYHGLLAEACAAAGRAGEGLANISIGLAFQSKNGEVWNAADLHRIQGDLLLQGGDTDQAKASYQRALAVARQAGARPIESRATARLRQLRSSQDGVKAGSAGG